MSDLHHEDRRLGIVDRIHDAEATLPNAVLVVTGEPLAAGRARIRRQLTDTPNHPRPIPARQVFEFDDPLGMETDAVGQFLVARREAATRPLNR